jgi:5-methylcytosine-specific restriction endonuclease McrA
MTRRVEHWNMIESALTGALGIGQPPTNNHRASHHPRKGLAMGTLTPTRTVDAPPDPTEEDGYAPEQIQAQIEQIATEQKQADALKKQIRESKDQLKSMIARVQISNEEFKSWIFQMYWNTDGNTPILRSLVKRRLGDAHHTWTALIEGSTEWPCSKCGTKVKRTFSSKSAFKSAKSRRYPFLCPVCEQERNAESEARHADYQRRVTQLQDRIVELRAMPYAEYLQSPEWNETRKAALKRAGYKCQLCNSNGQLHVHHKTYEHLGNEYAKDLITLCADCHAKIHDKESRNG